MGVEATEVDSIQNTILIVLQNVKDTVVTRNRKDYITITFSCKSHKPKQLGCSVHVLLQCPYFFPLKWSNISRDWKSYSKFHWAVWTVQFSKVLGLQKSAHWFWKLMLTTADLKSQNLWMALVLKQKLDLFVKMRIEMWYQR